MNLIFKSTRCSFFAAILSIAGPCFAQDISFDASPAFQLDPVLVIGTKEDLLSLPGSGAVLVAADIRDSGYTNGNKILNRVPGVYVREEDGFGNFPNISIRGGDGTRNEKVTVMEDGILTAPAAYSAPGAYYSPKAARMSGIEVLKGSSQVRFGPHTTGGVINYQSTPVPEDHNVFLRTTYGTDNTVQGQAYYGDIVEGDFGRVGFLGEIFYQQSDGFRKIDAGRGFSGSDDTGFSVTEPMVKFFWEPNSTLEQRFEAKYGYSDFDADETYLGLTESDYAANPSRRYAGSLYDNITSKHHRSYLKYSLKPSDTLTLGAAAYYNKFERNWYKIRKANGESLHQVLANPGRFSDAFNTLRLQGPGDLGLRANSRNYEQYGAQITGDLELTTGTIDHQIHLGARLHHDEIRRFQRDDKINVSSSGLTGITRGEDGSGGNRFQKADALALWIEDEVTIGALSIRPGVRYESIDLGNTDYESNSKNKATAVRDGSIDYIAPGIGFNLEATDGLNLFGGAFKGVSVPGPRAILKDGVQEEESIGYELGIRHNTETISAELVGFFSDFDNLIGSDTGLGDSNATNAGKAEVYGVEAAVSYNPTAGTALGLPMYVSATWTNATLGSSLASGGADDIYAGGQAGADIPYIPEWKIATGIGLEGDRWGVNLDATYTSSAFGTARNLSSPADSSRQGKIDEVFLLDLSAHYLLTDQVKLFAGIQNALDESYVVSRLPEGPRSGAPQYIYCGVELKF